MPKLVIGINIVTRWQALEYITSQNMDRRAFASLNCITVVPGAVGAWRRELIEKAGGFQSDTLAEDQDLTLTFVAWVITSDMKKMRSPGLKLPIACTRSPGSDSVGLLAPCSVCANTSTHCFARDNGALGFIALPNVWIFQILFPLIFAGDGPDARLHLAGRGSGSVATAKGYSSTALRQVLFYYALFLAIDWVSASFAFCWRRRNTGVCSGGFSCSASVTAR